MKHIKPYKIFESQQSEHPGFPSTEKEIHRLCKKYKIYDYTINDDLSIDVDGHVYIANTNLKYIPLNFNVVNGDLNIEKNELVSLQGCAKIVNDGFYCQENKLTSLKYSPQRVNGIFRCSYNNIISLKYLSTSGISYTSLFTSFENNPIHSVVKTFIKNDNAEDLIQEFNDYDIVRSDRVVLDRLKVFISDFDLKMPNLDEVKEYYEIV